MTDQAEKFKPKEATPLDSKVREASEVETREAGLHNEENKKIHDQTQARHKIGHSATDLMIPNQSAGPSLEMVDEDAGYVLTGKGYKPLVPEDISKTYKAILQDIPEVEDPALLPDKVAEATIEYYRAKGMIPDETTSSLEDLQQQCSYNPDDQQNGSDRLPVMTEDEAVYYRVHKSPGHTLIEGGIEHQNQVKESAGAPSQNPWQALLKLTPEQRQKFIESMSNAGSVAKQSINETSDDILRKTAQGYIDTAVGLVKFPLDVAVAAGKGIWGIVEFERDLMVDPERAQKTAATTGDSIGKALVAGIKLWAAGSEYGSAIQQKGDYVRPFQDLGNAINKWYDSLTPGDQMHAMATISAGFGLSAAAGQLRQLAKPGAFVQFMEEAAQAVPKNPEAQARAAESVKKLIEAFSRSNVRKFAAEGPAIDQANDMLNMEKRIYKSPKTGRELTPGKAAEEAGLDKSLSPVEKMKELLQKGFGLIEPKQYHIDGCKKPLSETAMAKHLKIDKDDLRAMTTEQLEAKGIITIEPVNGRLPLNWEWAGKTYPFAEKHPKLFRELQKDFPEITEDLKDGILFTKDGHPEFSKFALDSKQIKSGFIDRNTDFYKADKMMWPWIKNAKEGKALRDEMGVTWHHHEDGHSMLLVPSKLHSKVGHTGGIADSK